MRAGMRGRHYNAGMRRGKEATLNRLSRAAAAYGSQGGTVRMRSLSGKDRTAFARAGATALNASLTAEERSESARRAAQARWGKRKK